MEEKTLEYWDDRWKKNETFWHRDSVSPVLLEHKEELFASRSNIKIFVPLCGKSLDMKWFTDLGHKVVGVESSVLPIESFFKEQSVPFTVESKSSLTVYRNQDDSVRIYQCNLFDFSVEMEGQFDAIWDRGSLVAINAVDREKYAELLTSLMAPGCRYVLNAIEYNEAFMSGPPRNVPEKLVHKLYSDRCVVRRFGELDRLEYARKSYNEKLDYFLYVYYTIVLK